MCSKWGKRRHLFTLQQYHHLEKHHLVTGQQRQHDDDVDGEVRRNRSVVSRSLPLAQQSLLSSSSGRLTLEAPSRRLSADSRQQFRLFSQRRQSFFFFFEACNQPQLWISSNNQLYEPDSVATRDLKEMYIWWESEKLQRGDSEKSQRQQTFMQMMSLENCWSTAAADEKD